MRKSLVISSILLLIILSACGSPKASVEEFSIIETVNIPITEEISMLTDVIMVNDNFYCISTMEKLFLILDLGGNIIKSYSATGNGPGELNAPTTLVHDIEKNSIGILDSANFRISYFDYEGNHVEDVKIDDFTHFPIRIQMLPNYKLEKYMNINTSGDGPMITMNDDFIQDEKIVSLQSYEFNPMSQNFSNGLYLNSSAYANSFYTFYIKTTAYEFKVYNSEGELSGTIQKDYNKVEQPEEVVKEIEEQLENAKNMAKQYGQDFSIDPDSYRYKQAINKILQDAKNRVWVLTQDQESSFFDIYDESGKLIGKCPAKTEDFKFSFFQGDKIYSITVDEDEGVNFKQFELK